MIPTLEIHKSTVAKHASKIEADCQSGNCYTYYATPYYLHGMLSGVEASGDEQLLQQTIDYLNLMIQAATPLVKNNITYHYWKCPPPSGDAVTGLGSDGYPLQLHHFQALGPFARAAYIIASHPTWKEKYKRAAYTLANFARHNGLEYWFDKEHGVYAQSPPLNWVAARIPRLPPDLGGGSPAAQYAPPNHPREWNDKDTLAGTLAAWLAAANPQDWFCLDIANRIATAFQRRLTLQKGGWVWDVLQVNWDVIGVTIPPDKNTPDQDTNHTNREPQFLIACHQAGVVFTHDDLNKMALALTNRIWNGDIANPAFSNYLTGRNEPYAQGTSKYEPWQVGTIYHGWAMLGRYNPICRLVMESVCSQVLSGYSGQALSKQSFTPQGEVSMSGHCLLNRKPA